MTVEIDGEEYDNYAEYAVHWSDGVKAGEFAPGAAAPTDERQALAWGIEELVFLIRCALDEGNDTDGNS